MVLQVINLNLLDCKECRKVRKLLNLLCQNDMVLILLWIEFLNQAFLNQMFQTILQ